MPTSKVQLREHEPAWWATTFGGPQFIVFTADDAIQSYTPRFCQPIPRHRKNPNGCTPKMTYYTSLSYTNYTLVTGTRHLVHTLAMYYRCSYFLFLSPQIGVPCTLPQLLGGYTQRLYKAGFEYDSSASASIPVTDPNTDAYWPYTLDYGMANDCLMVPGTCQGQLKLPGFWEMPMYAFFDKRGNAGPHLMDPWLDTANGNDKVSDQDTLEYMKDTFTAHYNGNRQPIGLYTHPIHLALDYPRRSSAYPNSPHDKCVPGLGSTTTKRYIAFINLIYTY
ncbi:hypothetical protein AAF712_003490 [Marasmius tenuissimus]|uniref:Uncharacterized protein n=1 Tax=Marasmius tenuissimus TaxID=585030 RepID=A0ABR3A917_9AGAR